MTITTHAFADAASLIEALAGQVADQLAGAVAARGRASLVVSGGRTPEALFRALAARPLDWAALTVTLADERWVAADDPASNEALVRRTLLAGAGAAARFVPLYTGAPSPEQGEAACAAALQSMPHPFDLVLLGMGDDGHTASLFPGASNLAAALDGKAPCLAIRAPGAAQPRMTLTLPALLDSRRLVLLTTGEQKRQTLQTALEDGPVDAMPVRAVLRQDRVPVDVFWAP